MPAQPLARTTLSLPADLLAAIDRLVSEGRAQSRNDLMVKSLRAEVERLERAVRDAEFQAMAEDAAYKAEARQLLAEFAAADHEAWKETDESAS